MLIFPLLILTSNGDLGFMLQHHEIEFLQGNSQSIISSQLLANLHNQTFRPSPLPISSELLPKNYLKYGSLKQIGNYKIYLPIVYTPENTMTHYYAQVNKQGTFYGVWGIIETADPVIREPKFSYSSINIIGPSGQWIETGWIKSSTSGCIPKFSWATQEGNGQAQIIENPLPTVGVSYGYILQRTSPGYWKLWITRTDGVVIVNVDILNTGFNFGDQIQALGEVDSPTRLNDMGVSGLKSLLWKDISSSWYSWNGWQNGIVDSPYQIVGIPPDINNNVQVYGNNGNPIPPSAPCP